MPLQELAALVGLGALRERMATESAPVAVVEQMDPGAALRRQEDSRHLEWQADVWSEEALSGPDQPVQKES